MATEKGTVEVSTSGQSLYVSIDNHAPINLIAHRLKYDPIRGMNYEPEDLLRPAERVPNLGLYPVVKY